MTYIEKQKELDKEFDKEFPTQEIMEAVDIGEGQGDVVPVGIDWIKIPDPQGIQNYLHSRDLALRRAAIGDFWKSVKGKEKLHNRDFLGCCERYNDKGEDMWGKDYTRKEVEKINAYNSHIQEQSALVDEYLEKLEVADEK